MLFYFILLLPFPPSFLPSSFLPPSLPSFLSFFLSLSPFLLSCVADRVFVLQPGVRLVPLSWENQVQDIGPTETSWLHVISNGKSSPRDLHLNAKTQLHSMTSKLQCWTPYAEQLARKEHNPTH